MEIYPKARISAGLARFLPPSTSSSPWILRFQNTNAAHSAPTRPTASAAAHAAKNTRSSVPATRSTARKAAPTSTSRAAATRSAPATTRSEFSHHFDVFCIADAPISFQTATLQPYPDYLFYLPTHSAPLHNKSTGILSKREITHNNLIPLHRSHTHSTPPKHPTRKFAQN